MDSANGSHQGNDGRDAGDERTGGTEEEPMGQTQEGALQRRSRSSRLRRPQLKLHPLKDVAQVSPGLNFQLFSLLFTKSLIPNVTR